MIKKRKPYKTYTKEFKLEAIRLVENSERRNQIYKWKEQLASKGDAAFSGRGRPYKDNESEPARLRAEIKRLKEENDIIYALWVLCQRTGLKYAFIQRHRKEHKVVVMCKMMELSRVTETISGPVQYEPKRRMP